MWKEKQKYDLNFDFFTIKPSIINNTISMRASECLENIFYL